MQPALNPDTRVSSDYVFLSRWAVHSYDVERGDIVSLISPKDPDQKIIKRVVAFQGDVVSTLGYKKPIVRIPEGHCWVEGDHTGAHTRRVFDVIDGICDYISTPKRQLIGQQLIRSDIGWHDDGPSLVHRLAAVALAATGHQFAQAATADHAWQGNVQHDGCDDGRHFEAGSVGQTVPRNIYKIYIFHRLTV